ncbi:unnamed protein product [Soboliphyme baturini]|uniref:Rab-GAP TBC domain-containing protein n=1 Tax=Soboliphyme baturini TaxID=241478 RepID=A0A183IBY3_9BILA|nr:unnamed protein product [Soboliphyme baturini]
MVVHDTDLETHVPSDNEDTELDPSLSEEQKEVLRKMKAINRANELDSRSVSGTGSKRSADSSDSFSNCEVVPSQLGDETEDLWEIWAYLVKSWETESKKQAAMLKQLVRQGIPCHFRTLAWQLLSNAKIEAAHEMYTEYMRGNSPHEKAIRRDISRTFPEHEFFRDITGAGQQSLFNVMKAYSLHDREVGYCQGSAFVVGLLLLQMPEEEAFAVLIQLMEEYRFRELYKPAMTELGLCIFQLECLVQEFMPDLHTHFQNMGFDTSMYASSWFLTLFITQVSIDLASRIMDVFISEVSTFVLPILTPCEVRKGMDIIFRVAIAILQLCRVDLLKLDMEGMLRYFQKEVPEKFVEDHELLMTTAYNVKYNPKKFKKLEKDYLNKRNKDQEEAVELRV